MKQFDLFVCECYQKDTFFSIDSVIDKINKIIGEYIEIRTVRCDDNSAVTRNLIPGNIQLIVYLPAIDNTLIHTGFTKVQENINGVCLISRNIDTYFNSCFECCKDEDLFVKDIIKAFCYGVYICKQMNYDILKDNYNFINNKIEEFKLPEL